MQIVMPGTFPRPSLAVTKFLTMLDKKLSVVQTYYDSHLGRNTTDIQWTDERLSKSEILYLTDCINANIGLALQPWAYDLGYCYHVLEVEPKPAVRGEQGRYTRRVTFDSMQLPEDYTFEKMANVFMQESNVQKLVDCGFEAPTRDRARYEY